MESALFVAAACAASAGPDVASQSWTCTAWRVLSGKYMDPAEIPANSRMELFKGFMARYRNSDCNEAVRQYAKAADDVSVG